MQRIQSTPSCIVCRGTAVFCFFRVFSGGGGGGVQHSSTKTPPKLLQEEKGWGSCFSCTSQVTLAVFTWERITFRKTFRIVIQIVIGIVIWTTCVHMHCKRLPNQDQDLRTARWYFAPTAQSARIDPCMASAHISKMHMHESHSKRAFL